MLCCVYIAFILVYLVGNSIFTEGNSYYDHVDVQWFAPFLSGGGYSSEAMAFAGVLDMLDSVTSIENRQQVQERKAAKERAVSYSGGGGQEDLVKDPLLMEEQKVAQSLLPFSMSFNMVHHGDSPSQTHIDGFTPKDRALLESHFNLPKQSSGGLDGRTTFNDDHNIAADGISAEDPFPDTIILGGGGSRPKRILQIVICHSEPGAWHAPTPRYHTQRCPPVQTQYSQQKYEQHVQSGGRRTVKKSRGIEFSQFRIGRTMFETDQLPSGWPSRLKHMHEVWVPTKFAYDIFANAMGNNHTLAVVEEPVDTDFFHPIDYSQIESNMNNNGNVLNRLPSTLASLNEYIEAKATMFLFVGKWEERKGIRMLIRSFYRAMTESSNNPAPAVLVILTSVYHSTNKFDEEIQKILKEEGLFSENCRREAKYILLTDIPQDHMPHLYSAVTVLVIPSTGEGWGRPHVEAMACGTPVIATAWSGPTAYLTEENGYPLRVAGMQNAAGWEGHHWALPDEEHLRSLLLQVHVEHHTNDHNDGTLRRKGQQAREDMVARYSSEAFSLLVAKELTRIAQVASQAAERLLDAKSELLQDRGEEDEL